jgi:vacuolar-type H+-ATPase subunit E/Vma4
MSKANAKGKLIPGSDDGKSALIRGIEDDAAKQARDIVEAAEKSKRERIEASEKQAENIVNDAKAKALAEVRSIQASSRSLISIDTKRQMLKLQERAIAIIMEEVRNKMEALVVQPAYADMLRGWIVEGAIGLERDQVSVNASSREKKLITEKLLREAEKEFATLTGRTVTITLSKDESFADQGVIVLSGDKKTAFNNQVETRLARYENEIRKLIYRELFGE